jgi:polysaccharide biosynthesis protein PslJ
VATATVERPLLPQQARKSHPLKLPSAWAFYALFGLFPLWWVLGLAGFIWPILAVPMLVSLVLRRRALRYPKGFGIWFVFVAWMLITVTQVTQFSRVITFCYRASLYFSATVLFLYVYNASIEELPNRKALKTMTIFFLFVVFGGFLGVAFPSGGFPTPMEKLMPQRFLQNPWVFQLVHPTFSEIHTFLGFPVGRPTAPFVYTNEWGANMGLLIPLVVAGWAYSQKRGWNNLTFLAIMASVIPMIVSLNRGLWLSLTIGLVYASWRYAIRGRTKTFGAILISIALAGALIVFTPLRSLLSDRLQVGHSNYARETLDAQAISGALQAPILGYGSPLPSTNPHLPDIGTQGQLWLVLYSHGFPGAILFVGWFVYAAWATRRARTPVELWPHVMLVVLLVQLPFYGMLPSAIHVVMVGSALAFRDTRLRRERWEQTEPATSLLAPPAAALPVR